MDLVLSIPYFEALEQTCRLHQLSGSGDKYFFLLALSVKATVLNNLVQRESSRPINLMSERTVLVTFVDSDVFAAKVCLLLP
jgi:hypothetical protein